jgi:SAM-dependent methyltransferase
MTAGQFAMKVAGDAGSLAAIALAALGDRLGLFAVLRAAGPLDAAGLAARAGVKERYAREWLLAMGSARYLERDEAGRYTLSPERAAVLADDGPLSLCGTMHLLIGMLDALGPLERAFREGGGVPPAAYPESTWDGMERDMGGIYAAYLAREWVPAMPEVRALLERGAEVADVGCGRGRALIELARAFPRSRYVGFDSFAPNVEAGRRNAQAAGVAVAFEQADAVRGLPRQFDVILALDVVHDASDPLALLSAIRSALRPGGRFFSLDPRAADRPEDNRDPLTTLRFGFSVLYCLPASGGAGLGTLGLTDARMRALCAEAGFTSVREVDAGGSFHRIYECG